MEYTLSELREQVMTARASQRALHIRGGGTKDFYGEPAAGVSELATLDLSDYKGVINYQPSELVITARAGTLLSEIEETLAEHRQMLAFEPPRFGAGSTLGGCIASGLSGPRRMAAGSVRDFVLGTALLDSSGTVLKFGGEVMKNVAGYDMSRVLAGSMGIFGALLEVSVKVAPKPFEEVTQTFELEEDDALDQLRQWRSLPLPISATAWCASDSGPSGLLHVRLSGSEPAVASGSKRIGGQSLATPEAEALWDSLRDQTHPFFDARPLWRVAVPANTPALGLGSTLIEWGGGLRWIAQPELDPTILRARVASAKGHATLYRYTSKASGLPVFHPLEPGVMDINRRLKQAMDPVAIFNPKRLFTEF